eukprot:3100148-Pyramimonas_sp.AAC.1
MKLRGSLHNSTDHLTEGTNSRSPRIINVQGQVAARAENDPIQGFNAVHPDEGSGEGTSRHNPRGDKPRT